ncbi:dermonecrotic toxin domain-containing protein [Pseudomonas sp. Hz4]
MPETSTPSAVDVLTQLVTGPSLTEVAAHALRPALATLYPHLKIDPARAMVATPTWLTDGETVKAGPCRFESLTDALVRLALSGTAATCIDGEHFLTEQPGVEPVTQLPVKIEAIAARLNELAPLLFIAYQEQQLDYWNETTAPDQPRWHQLSHTLQQLWNVSANNGWDEDQRAMAHAVFGQPDKLLRLATDKYKTRVCLIDLDDTAHKHLNVLDAAVLVGTLGKRTLILMHSLTKGFQRFDTFEALGQTLQSLVKNAASSLSWRLFEPEGNFFDHQACTLIALEAEAIGAIDFFQRSDEPILTTRRGAPDNQQAMKEQRTPHFSRLQHSIPQWLEDATPADQNRYSRHLLNLAVVQQQNAGKTFQSELPGIKKFTRDELEKQIKQTPAQTEHVDLKDVEITVTSVEVWGTFVPPGHVDTQTLSLVDLALENLGALALGNKSVRHRDGAALPEWMTIGYLEELVTTVDIGEVYPALLQNRLIDDTSQASRLQQLFTQQLPLELPLLALQYKIRGEGGLTEQGYRYVVAALASERVEQQVDGQRIVVRPLAFVTGDSPTGSADEVVNMFVIGPQDQDNGPCLLYRPLLELALLQYPSTANLLYAIKHSRSLRQSVLAWLPDSVRFNYSQYVFPGALPSVWTVPQLLIDPTLSLNLPGPVTLGHRVIENDVLTTLFKANAEALIAQADSQSVSNAEARWASLKRGGWALFSVALPFLGRGVNTAAWIWQIMDDLQDLAEAAEQQQKPLAWAALADLFLTLGMVLAHRAATRKKPQGTALAIDTEKAPAATEEVKIASISATRLADIPDHELPSSHELSLHDLGAVDRSRPGLGTVLDSLKITKPETNAKPATEGPYRHLTASGQKWYAGVAERWFEVELNDNDDVQIIDSRQRPPRKGPLLISNQRGEWFVDLRLRLRGGGLRSRRKQLQQQNHEQLRKKKEDITAFDAGLTAKRLQLVEVRRAMLEATPETADSARQHFLDTLDTQIGEYTTHIQELKALNILEAVPNYRTAMLDRISLQLFLMQSWLSECDTTFRDSLRVTLELLDGTNSESTSNRSEPFETMTELTQRVIDKVEFAQTRFAELSLLGKEAAEVTRQYKARLPPFSLDHLKMLQITLGRKLCLKGASGAAREEAQVALESLVEDAALNIQSALDLSTDESLNNLGERTDALNNLVEQFAIIDQRFLDFAAEFAEHQVPDRLEKVQKRVAEFGQRTAQHLSDLLREQRHLEPVAGPSKPVASTAKKIIIKTRFKGTLVGQRRQSAKGKDSHLVDVVAPLTGKVIATFHEKTPGVWLERVSEKNTPSPKAKPDLAKSVLDGKALLEQLPAFKQRTQAHLNRAQRNPTETEEVYYLHADHLRNVMDRIDQALTAGNSSTTETATATLRQQLDTEATALYATGRVTRIAMTKQQAPTAARVEWLHEKGELRIAKTAERRRLKGPRRDYLQEYEILDKKTNKVLWYAHFHYANPTDPLPSFTAAHLKTADQRRLGGAYDWRENHSNHELIAIHRSAISRSQAAALFFS